jgi:hypothetical protein
MLDPTKNFAKGKVVGVYDADDLYVDVEDASVFPNPEVDGEFNLVWYNHSDYPDPSDDPNVEIIRVTGYDDTNRFSILRSQEGTVASTKNRSQKIYKLIRGFTKKDYDEIISDTDKVETITITGDSISALEPGQDIELVAPIADKFNVLRDIYIKVSVTEDPLSPASILEDPKYKGLMNQFGEGPAIYEVGDIFRYPDTNVFYITTGASEGEVGGSNLMLVDPAGVASGNEYVDVYRQDPYLDGVDLIHMGITSAEISGLLTNALSRAILVEETILLHLQGYFAPGASLDSVPDTFPEANESIKLVFNNGGGAGFHEGVSLECRVSYKTL